MSIKSTANSFSVLMSVYYKENPNYLDLALESILTNQTVKPTEIILVEDGKLTDELDSVIDKYCKKFPSIMKIYPLEENRGLGEALNYGLEKCNYDLIMRMDSDDISVSNRFEKQLEYMEKNKDISIVGGFIKEFTNDPSDSNRIKSMPITYEEILKYVKFRNPLNHMTVCFRKKDILEVGSYQPLQYLEDHYLWSRVLASGKKIGNIPETLVYARIGNGFSERRGSKKYISGWRFLQKYLYEHKLINRFQRVRNVLCMYAFTSISSKTRDKLYNKILRKESTTNDK